MLVKEATGGKMLMQFAIYVVNGGMGANLNVVYEIQQMQCFKANCPLSLSFSP